MGIVGTIYAEMGIQAVEGITMEIEYHKNKIELLTKELEQLRKRNKDKIENISERLKLKLRDVERIVTEHPDKIDIWTELINRDYNQDLTQDELKKMIERWV